ncbi:MAG: Nif-specific regulatory protein, partial [Blastocatellia bacterium]|nr:Nif-specific regulatory protein [Blastocatellia bacterium]
MDAMETNITGARSGPKDYVKNDSVEGQKLATLLEIGQTLADTPNLKGALGRVLETLGQHHGMLRSFVMLLDADEDKLRAEACYGINAETARRVHYRVGEGVVGRVVESGKPIVVTQASREPLLLNRFSARERNSSRHELSFICVPVRLGGKPVGALGADLHYKQDRDYDGETKFLAIVASMMAQALKVEHLIEADKQQLLDENIHLKQELRERYDFSHIIGNSSPLREVYE